MSDADSITRLNAALEGRYRIERELGEGGKATVYLADDLKHEGKVAYRGLCRPRSPPSRRLCATVITWARHPSRDLT